jgi:hypothetical protein
VLSVGGYLLAEGTRVRASTIVRVGRARVIGRRRIARIRRARRITRAGFLVIVARGRVGRLIGGAGIVGRAVRIVRRRTAIGARVTRINTSLIPVIISRTLFTLRGVLLYRLHIIIITRLRSILIKLILIKERRLTLPRVVRRRQSGKARDTREPVITTGYRSGSTLRLTLSLLTLLTLGAVAEDALAILCKQFVHVVADRNLVGFLVIAEYILEELENGGHIVFSLLFGEIPR